jgi:formate dehydrogenase subunit delta
MNTAHLINMANQIGRFYEVYPDRAEALKSAAMHLRRFWEPRMRVAFFEHLDAGPGDTTLDPFMLEAVRTHRKDLMPAESTSPL